MLISQLPAGYKEKALSLQKNNDNDPDFDWCKKTDNLMHAFNWEISPDGDEFWEACHDAKTVEELPELK